MDKIFEVMSTGNIMLSQSQKFVLTKLALPELTPQQAYELTTQDVNISSARDMLAKYSLIEQGDNEVSITDKGQRALESEGLMDNGTLTPDGERYAYAESLDAIGKIDAQGDRPADPDMSGGPGDEPQGDGSAPTASLAVQSDQEAKPSFESWSMVLDAAESLKHTSFLKTHRRKL